KPGTTHIGFFSFVNDLAADVARAYDVQILSDSYWPDAVSIQSAFTGEPIALFSLLDRYAGFTHRWDHHGGGGPSGGAGPRVIRLRSRTWFLQRPREVPLRLVRRW